MKQILVLCLILIPYLRSYTQNTTINDSNFEQALIDLGHDTGSPDGSVPTANISGITLLNVENKSISDLTGIEDFTSLETLRLGHNSLSSIDLSQNANLNVLVINNNSLTTVDLSQNAMLYEFIAYDNQLTSFTLPVSIRTINVKDNLITSIDASTYTNLLYLQCRNNPLESLNVKNTRNDILNVVLSWNDTSYPHAASLSCIQVDNSGDANAIIGDYDEWQKKSHVTYAENCSNPKTWTGTIDNSWSNPSNWDGGVPDSSSFVTISNTANSPNISGGTEASTGTLYIESGASFVIGANSSITIDGSINNQGSLTIESSGSIIAKNAVSTQIAYQRQVTNDWHLVSSPVSDQDINDFTVTNAATNNIATSGNNYGIGTYDNDGNSWQYYNTSNILAAGNFINGKGYAALRNTSGIFSFSGSIPTEDITINITDGSENEWNLLGNPYPSYIPANSPADAVNNILTVNSSVLHPVFQAMYFWDSASGSYSTVNNTTSSRFIAPGQGFFVRSIENSGSSSFSFTENMQSHQSSETFNRNTDQIFGIQLHLTNGDKTRVTDIKYIQNTSKGLDPGYDAGMFQNGNSDLSLFTYLVDNSLEEKFSIQCLPDTDHDKMIIPIGMESLTNESIEFSAIITNIPNDYRVYLEDRLLNIFHPISETSYATTSSSNDLTGRFFIHVTSRALSLNTIDESSINVYLSDKATLRIAGLNPSTETEVQLFSLRGKLLLRHSFAAKGNDDIDLPHHLVSGLYLTSILTGSKKITKKIFIR